MTADYSNDPILTMNPIRCDRITCKYFDLFLDLKDKFPHSIPPINIYDDKKIHMVPTLRRGFDQHSKSEKDGNQKMNMLDNEPFPVRFGIATGPAIDNDFPTTARDGLWHVLNRAVLLKRTTGWVSIANELLRLRRLRETFNDETAVDVVAQHLHNLRWDWVYIFCERMYKIILKPEMEYDYNNNPDVLVSIEDVRHDFETDINQLFAEEGIVYRMTEGLLHRPGRLHSQRVTAKAQVVLQDQRLRTARVHFTKAQRFFTACPDPDLPNSIKEAVSSLEAAAKSLFPTKSNDFEKCLREIRDVDGEVIPPTILNGLMSTYRFRGAGEGIAHGGTKGGKPTAALTEWVLSVVASSIIYLRDLAIATEDDAPPF